MLNPESVLKFQQQFKQLQINAGLGIDENNIDKVSLIVENLNDIAIELYYQIHPMPEPLGIDKKSEIENKIVKK